MVPQDPRELYSIGGSCIPFTSFFYSVSGKILSGSGALREKENAFFFCQADAIYADAYDNLGWLYARAGNYNESIMCFTRAIELKPDNGWAYYYRGRIRHKIGEVHMALRDAEEACRLGLQEGCTMYERLKKEFL